MKPENGSGTPDNIWCQFACWPDPLCVCCENNQHCGCFVPPISRNLEPRAQKKKEEAKFTRGQILSHTHVRTYTILWS